ncbi:adenosylcobinamide-phosphate synthase CbiB [Hyphomicrobium sp.]|uniref:adenosylcobinamide-phosphate synthase CbiB n=1 Tax=Hyphomicrobium sp. TaxID=82 RepID=UPI001DDEE776|nr:adenosylcobinamide-phosphate synthase CbiB [Hyphomicrobium sp.]MBY0560857.1 adenosylcobinamide-phosphate synthase CbiB [Hyphomicrobium sp.]
MSEAQTLLIVAGALTLEALFGYPNWLYERVGHPVTWIGSLISALDHRLNQESESVEARRLAGVLALGIIVLIVGAVAWVIERASAYSAIGEILIAVLASTLIASRSLYDHVAAVARALANDGLKGGRLAVGRIVGRNPETLDEHGVARAAIESLAENASDGVVAPVFWFAFFGLPGLAVYKAINTADSMIGHRTPRHEAFGWAAARLDDLVNLPASRLTGLLFAGAALFVPKASPAAALEAMSRDASKHRSPNAGWAESAMAGALEFKLNGPKVYGNVRVEDAYMGDGRRDLGPDDIDAALRLAMIAWAIMIAVLLLFAAILRG